MHLHHFCLFQAHKALWAIWIKQTHYLFMFLCLLFTGIFKGVFKPFWAWGTERLEPWVQGAAALIPIGASLMEMVPTWISSKFLCNSGRVFINAINAQLWKIQRRRRERYWICFFISCPSLPAWLVTCKAKRKNQPSTKPPHGYLSRVLLKLKT